MSDSPKKLQVSVAGDWQLWVVIGQFDKGDTWRLPVKALPYRTEDGTEIFFVHRAMDLGVEKYDAVCPVLDSRDLCPKDERGWWFRRSDLDKIAVKAEGITFDRQIQWPDYKPSLPDSKNPMPDSILVDPDPKLSPSEIEFLKRLQLVTGDLSPDSLRHVWLSIRKEAINRLAADRKVLDLGFIRLVPVPYRPNWKEMLCVRFSSLLHVMRRPRAEWKLDSLGLHGALASVKMFAMDRAHRFVHWTIEAVPSNEMEKAIDEDENAAFGRLGPAAYADRVLGQVAKRLNDILDVLKHHTERVNMPTATTAKGRLGSTVLIADRNASRVRPGHGLCEHVDAVITDAMEKFTDDEPKPDRKKLEPDAKTFHRLFRDEGFIDLADVSPNQDSIPANGRAPSNLALVAEASKEVGSNKNTQHDRNGADQAPVEPPDDTGEVLD